MNIMIIGANSYIGCHLESFLSCKGHKVSSFDVKNKSIEECNLSGVHAVVIVAAIVHQKKGISEELYDLVNAELPLKVALHAKKYGVTNIIFFSTMSVYGCSKSFAGTIIDKDTPLNPISLYGRSKLKGEQNLARLTKEMRIAIVRPANVYGKGCPGNYLKGFICLSKLFLTNPKMKSNAIHGLIYIENLCNAIYHILIDNLEGVFHLQDFDSPSANDFIKMINFALDKKKKTSNCFWNILKINKKIFVKIFGGISYEKNLLFFSKSTQIVSTEEAIERSVK